MVVKREHISDKNFVYVYDPSLIFQRLTFMSNLSPHMAPPGWSSLVAEVSYRGFPTEDKHALKRQVQADLIAMGVVQPDDPIITTQVFDLPYAYPCMPIGWQEAVCAIRDYLERQDIYLFGRFGEWNYLNIHDIIPQGRDLAERLKERYE
jgi:UDP-galactopyranose mutase